jgi:Tfp pilus assembly protein PilZ
MATEDQTMTTSFGRIPLITRCLMTCGETSRDAMVCSVSLLGIYLILERSPGEGEAVQVRFMLPDGGPAVECEAFVTWVNLEWPQRIDNFPPGCGLRFLSMKPHDHARIATLVEDYRSAAHPVIARPRPDSGYTRVPYVQPCAIDGVLSGVICNISLAGLYVAVDPIPVYGHTVTVAMRLPGVDALIEIQAEVAWINPDEPVKVESLPAGCGLRFTALPSDVAQAIVALVDDFLSIPRELPPWLAQPDDATGEP